MVSNFINRQQPGSLHKSWKIRSLAFLSRSYAQRPKGECQSNPLGPELPHPARVFQDVAWLRYSGVHGPNQLLAGYGLGEDRRLLKAGRQAFSAVSSNEDEWNLASGQSGRDVLDRAAVKI